ncbi:MAG: ATP-binding cassette domain-containing protein, partial [Clostridia bacterium]|nr:ATP-binding cassette domain-containing protein [Clostridia bacterium]
MQLNVRDLSFTYEGSYSPVFDHVSFHVDTSWHLGLIARNGRGKTTLLRLMQGLHAYSGHIDLPLTPVYFPFPVDDPQQLTLFVMQAAAPDAEDWQLIRECNLLQLTEDALYRPFATRAGASRPRRCWLRCFPGRMFTPSSTNPPTTWTPMAG